LEFHVTPLFFGNPKSRKRRRRRLRFCLQLVVATPHVVPPPPLVLTALCRLLSADAPLHFASCMPLLPFASFLPAGCCVTPVVTPPPQPPPD